MGLFSRLKKEFNKALHPDFKGFTKNPGKFLKKSVGGSFQHIYEHRQDKEAASKAHHVAKNEQELIDAENAAADAANEEVAFTRRKRRLSSLFAGGRSILGAPAGRGSPAGAGTPSTSSGVAGGSAMGGGSRSYGGASSFTRGSRLYGGETMY